MGPRVDMLIDQLRIQSSRHEAANQDQVYRSIIILTGCTIEARKKLIKHFTFYRVIPLQISGVGIAGRENRIFGQTVKVVTVYHININNKAKQ